jgi:hypothetical protein
MYVDITEQAYSRFPEEMGDSYVLDQKWCKHSNSTFSENLSAFETQLQQDIRNSLNAKVRVRANMLQMNYNCSLDVPAA